MAKVLKWQASQEIDKLELSNTYGHEETGKGYIRRICGIAKGVQLAVALL